MEDGKYNWVLASKQLPENNGRYQVLIDGVKGKVVRIFRNGHWFGGVRPFADNQVITHWRTDEYTDAGQSFESPFSS